MRVYTDSPTSNLFLEGIYIYVYTVYIYIYYIHTRWAPTSYKWSYKPYKWPYKWVTGVIIPFITSRGPTLYIYIYIYIYFFGENMENLTLFSDFPKKNWAPNFKEIVCVSWRYTLVIIHLRNSCGNMWKAYLNAYSACIHIQNPWLSGYLLGETWQLFIYKNISPKLTQVTKPYYQGSCEKSELNLSNNRRSTINPQRKTKLRCVPGSNLNSLCWG